MIDNLRIKVRNGAHDAYACVLLCVMKYHPCCMMQTTYPVFPRQCSFAPEPRILIRLVCRSGHNAASESTNYETLWIETFYVDAATESGQEDSTGKLLVTS
jgi:hypothetical protein